MNTLRGSRIGRSFVLLQPGYPAVKLKLVVSRVVSDNGTSWVFTDTGVERKSMENAPDQKYIFTCIVATFDYF